MSLITRCPACETLFKVVPDQLRISEGWVRCGQCDAVFDASLHLLAAPLQGAESSAAADDQTQVANFQVTTLVPETRLKLDLDLDLKDSPSATADSCATDVEAGSSLMILSKPSLPDADAQDVTQPDLTAGAEFGGVSFLRDHHDGSFWRKPLVRAILCLISLGLLLGLLAQIVVQERDRIVAMEPNLKPWLLQLCEPLQCTLSPWRKIEAIVIESSSLTKIQGDSYRVNFTLKNTTTTPLAVPSIELTLTDAQDQPVVRRVFQPVEWGVTFDTFTAGFEWPASVTFSVQTGLLAERVVGYRLLAFYP